MLWPLVVERQSLRSGIFGMKHLEKNQESLAADLASNSSNSYSARPSRDERRALGKSLRDQCPRSSHSNWNPSADRPDPIALIEDSNQGRMQQLVPLRHGRMLQSPFAFFRGAALNMAADLAGTPATGIHVQACGDCHLMNFGAFATPERRIIFDINDLDETLPAPWEWDLKRLATSFVLACRDNGLSEEDGRDAALACVQSYREHMAEFSELSELDIWYASIDSETLFSKIKDEETIERVKKRLAKAREHNVLEHDFPQLASVTGGKPMIRDNPPLIYHPQSPDREELMTRVCSSFEKYSDTLQADRKQLLSRFQLVDAALKVVGVGSVGTYCFILLLMASEDDPLFLQVKQARPSVLEPYAGKSPYTNHGERIVNGHRLMQSASDIFLGWVEGDAGRHYYVRQLRDMKIKPLVEIFTASVMCEYAEACGWALAHAHARSGDPSTISGYLGKNDSFDKALADFAKAYADQTEIDYDAFRKSIRSGRLEAYTEDQ